MGGEITCVVVGLLETNCYLVKCDAEGSGVIIDPGDDSSRIVEECRRIGLRPELILLTHGHIDHTNAAGDLRGTFDCEVACHHLDEEMVRSSGPALWGLERHACQVDRNVSDGDVIVVGTRGFKVIHTPGHTPGSVCYLLDNVLFSGDTLFRGSIGRTDLPGGSEEEILRSLKVKLGKLDSTVKVFPGHGPPTTIGYEKTFNPFLQT